MSLRPAKLLHPSGGDGGGGPGGGGEGGWGGEGGGTSGTMVVVILKFDWVVCRSAWKISIG